MLRFTSQHFLWLTVNLYKLVISKQLTHLQFSSIIATTLTTQERNNMTSYFLKSGNTFKIADKESLDLHEKLPAGNYIVKTDMFGNHFLETISDFEIKGKLYGNNTRHADRIINTFLDRPSATGVMLVGEKGSGKTLLTKTIAINAAEMGIPTIVINTSYSGDKFNSFLQSIEQPCIILFDEFEKVYDEDSQEEILTLLDGVFPSKKLFLLTANDKWRVDKHMRNRPGRLYYMIEFKGVEDSFIKEYCEDNLKNKSHINSICQVAAVFDKFNFDMLKAIVEEMNRYNESPQEVLKLINAKPEFGNRSKFDVKLQIDGKDVPAEDVEDDEINCNPISDKISISYKLPKPDTTDDDYNWFTVSFETSELKHVDAKTGTFVFLTEDNDRLLLTKKIEQHFEYAF